MIILCRRFASIYPPPRPCVSDISLNFLIRLYVATSIAFPTLLFLTLATRSLKIKFISLLREETTQRITDVTVKV